MDNNQKKILAFMKLLKNSLENDVFVQFRKNIKMPPFHSGGFPEQNKF